MAALSGMKDICKYMGRSESTMLNIIRDLDFPAKKICGIWESDTELADKWRVKQISGPVDQQEKSEKKGKKATTQKTMSTLNNGI